MFENKANIEDVTSSCSNAEHECSACIEIIHLVVDCEACEEQMIFFKESISKCKSCMEYLENHTSILSEIKTKIDKKCCPKTLTDSILFSIKELSL